MCDPGTGHVVRMKVPTLFLVEEQRFPHRHFPHWGKCPSLSSTEAILGVITEAVFEEILGEVIILVPLPGQEKDQLGDKIKCSIFEVIKAAP